MINNKNLLFTTTKISIICIVKNDRGIKDTLFHIVKLKKKINIEVIVVDASEGKLNDIELLYPEVIWINYKNTTNKKITIPEQRNIGIRRAIGDIIVFIDANCIPSNNWLFELTKEIIENKENIVAGSVNALKDDKIWRMNKDTGIENNYLTEAPTLNIAIKKSVFTNVGLFDEDFSFGSDVDFTFRAIKYGYKIKLNSNALVSHLWGNLPEQINRARKYGEARAKIYTKHKDKLKYILQYNHATLFYPLFILFSPIAIRYPNYLLLLFIPIIKNYRNNPAKVLLLNMIYGFGVLKGIFLEIIRYDTKKYLLKV